MELKNITSNAASFFQFLPEDWRVEIEPYWSDYLEDKRAEIFVLEKEGKIVVGGIVFTTVSPDLKMYPEKAKFYFDQGLRYIAFLYVDEFNRSGKWGSRWMQEIENYYGDRKFWLTVDEFNLVNFYAKFNYRIVEEVHLLNAHSEWVLVQD